MQTKTTERRFKEFANKSDAEKIKEQMKAEGFVPVTEHPQEPVGETHGAPFLWEFKREE